MRVRPCNPPPPRLIERLETPQVNVQNRIIPAWMQNFLECDKKDRLKRQGSPPFPSGQRRACPEASTGHVKRQAAALPSPPRLCTRDQDRADKVRSRLARRSRAPRTGYLNPNYEGTQIFGSRARLTGPTRHHHQVRSRQMPHTHERRTLTPDE